MSLVVETLAGTNRKLCAFLERITPKLATEDLIDLDNLMKEIDKSLNFMKSHVEDQKKLVAEMEEVKDAVLAVKEKHDA
jgi:hypothetical protein